MEQFNSTIGDNIHLDNFIKSNGSNAGTNCYTIDYWQPYVAPYYPIYWNYWHNEYSKTEQAFRIVKVLLDKKIVKENITVKKFLELVTDIALAI